ncbi:MAG: membrane protein insertion efficiency factor YidD [Candidatus Moranbacteria bacterium]|nr:membrane protein insertion efficiency factor YidD [Candidatus Moranbacteria bacterium]
MFKKIFLTLIKIYQKTLSLDHGFLGKLTPQRACRFQPTCSQYAYESIDKFGIFKGFFLATKRILKCHPFSKGGLDKVPDR